MSTVLPISTGSPASQLSAYTPSYGGDSMDAAGMMSQPSQGQQSASSSRSSPWSINLPPQYQDRMNDANTYPDETELRMPFESLSDSQAARIVSHDFQNAANYRYQNHDWRWSVADALYTGWKNPRFWEGTKIPRSALPVLASFEQIESMMPRVMSALFGEPKWFEADPVGLSKPESARGVRNIILSQLSDCNPREQMRQVVKSGVMYGNGILDVGWHYLSRRQMQYIPEFRPRMKQIWHPIDGRPIQIHSGEFDRIIREFELEEVINQPYFAYIPLRRFYIDPNAPGPSIQGPKVGQGGARFTCVEVYMTVDELDALRRNDGFESMPDAQYLLLMSKEKYFTQADNGASTQESARRASYSPQIDQSTDPAAARLKVIIYQTKDRTMWMLNNSFLVYNKPNPLGRITQHNCFYADLLDRFYAMAISDVVEPEQRVQEGLINARMDELALSIHPQTVKQRGSGTPIYQVRIRPGGVSESQDPKNDVIRQYPQNATQSAAMEAQLSQLRVQKYTGITDLSMVGVGSNNNPAARTATGAGLQGQASFSRVQYFVENVEVLVLEPGLIDVFEYDQRFLDPNQMIETAQGEQLDPMAIWTTKIKFGMRASSRMASRQALIQVMPMALQAMLNPQLLQQLANIGMTVDLVEVMQMFMDATGYKEKTTWIRPLSPQEAQKINKPDPNMVKAQMQQQRMGEMNKMQMNKSEMDLLHTIVDGMMRRLDKQQGGSGSAADADSQTA